MEKIKTFVVVAVFELSGVVETELLGITESFSSAYQLIEKCDYEKIVTSQVAGEWTDEPNTPKYFTSTGGKQTYTEYHSFVCKSSFEDHYPVSAIFYIFEN